MKTRNFLPALAFLILAAFGLKGKEISVLQRLAGRLAFARFLIRSFRQRIGLRKNGGDQPEIDDC